MRLFISWSGAKSQKVAAALHEWIPYVINAVNPFMSSDSIESGQRWQSEIAKQLHGTNFGLICTTVENQSAPWLNFEAGALAKEIGNARVVPIAIDLEPSEIKLPLGQFNGEPLRLEGVSKLMRTMNSAIESPLELGLLKRSVEKWWPDLEAKIAVIAAESDVPAQPAEKVREDREILLEVLDTVRGLAREQVASNYLRQIEKARLLSGGQLDNSIYGWTSRLSGPKRISDMLGRREMEEGLAEERAQLAEREAALAEERAKIAEREDAMAEDLAEQRAEQEAAWEALNQDDPPVGDGDDGDR